MSLSLAGPLALLVGAAISAYVGYVVIRLAVRHALRDERLARRAEERDQR